MTLIEREYMQYFLLLSLVLNSIALQLIARKDRPNTKSKHYGYLLGLIAQPYWLVMFVNNENVLMFFIVLINTIAWFRGFINYWLDDNKDN